MVELKTVAVNVAVLLLFLNGSGGVLVASGTAGDLGVTPSVSGDQAVSDANQAAQDIKVSGGFASTLFALYNSVTGPARQIVGLVFGGPIILASIGIPGWLLDFIFLPQYFVVGGTVLYTLAGRRL
jgi:hypothetical protein